MSHKPASSIVPSGRLTLLACVVAVILFLPLPCPAQVTSIAADAAGNTYFSAGSSVFRVDAQSGTTAHVAEDAPLQSPGGLAIDSSGNLYIADSGNCVIRKVAVDGVISTVAGTGTVGYSGDGGPAIQAQFRDVAGVAVDGGGNLYIADSGNHRIRKVTPGGIITTVAGSGTYGYSGDGGAATAAQLKLPNRVAVDAASNLYIADAANHRVRRVALDGIITTVAGNGANGYSDGSSHSIRGQFLRHSREMTRVCSRNLTQVTRLRRG